MTGTIEERRRRFTDRLGLPAAASNADILATLDAKLNAGKRATTGATLAELAHGGTTPYPFVSLHHAKQHVSATEQRLYEIAYG